jgi:hypothetical protein
MAVMTSPIRARRAATLVDPAQSGGGTAPVGVLTGQAPAPVGPTIMDTMQADKAAAKAPSSGGMNWSNLLLALSAAAHDASYPQGNRLAETLAGFREQAQQDYMMRRQKMSDDWQQQQQARQVQAWGHEDARTRAFKDYVAQQPEDTRGIVESIGLDGLPQYMNQQRQQSNADRDYALSAARFGEDARHNRVSEFNAANGRTGAPSIAEARQWTNSYNDDVSSTLTSLGNLRAVIPYAAQVVQAGGQPSGNARMNDVALLRAAARAQTGPGVLTESEVFGTLSPSLQQALTRNMAYVDVARTAITPQDRLALARFVQQGATNASRDLWRRYSGAEAALAGHNVEPSQVGIAGPEYLHPDDQAAVDASRSGAFVVGQRYTAPSGRTYQYNGPGQWQYLGRGQYNRGAQLRRGEAQQSAANGASRPDPLGIR